MRSKNGLPANYPRWRESATPSATPVLLVMSLYTLALLTELLRCLHFSSDGSERVSCSNGQSIV